jgi:hypothetical protein
MQAVSTVSELSLAVSDAAHAAAARGLQAPFLSDGGGVLRRSGCHLSHDIFIRVWLMVARLNYNKRVNPYLQPLASMVS